MADPAAPQSSSTKALILSDRTFQEVEYLKKNLGPILVAALAEICIRRPADPIEYLGHWLLRWRYNEELKRRDVQNALEVVRQKAWTKDDEGLQPNPNAPDQPPAPDTFTQGFVPGSTNPPPGYGGPLDQGVVEDTMRVEGEAEDISGGGIQEETDEGFDADKAGYEEEAGEVEDYASAARGSSEKRLSQEKRASQENAEPSEKRPSQEAEGESGSRRGSRKSGATERKSGTAEANEE